MEDEFSFFEDKNYRMMEYQQGLSNDLYMMACGIEKCLPEKAVNVQNRDGYHLHAVISGRGMLKIDGKELNVHAEQLFLTVPKKVIWYQADGKEPWHYCWVTFDGCQAKKYLEYAGFTEGIYIINCKTEIPKFVSVLQSILQSASFKISGDLWRTGYAYQYIALAVESNEIDKKGSKRNIRLTTKNYIDCAIEYIEENYAHMKVNDITNYLGISRTYFSEIFKKKTYMTPQDYLIQIKMGKGKELLIDTDLPVNIVAQKVGYENQMTFSKMFKRKYGLSPENFRKKNRKE